MSVYWTKKYEIVITALQKKTASRVKRVIYEGYALTRSEQNYVRFSFASIVCCVCGTARRRSFGISRPVSIQIP